MTERDQVRHTPRVLLVDDDEACRYLTREALEEARYIVDEASSGEEALEYLETRQPDLILLDIEMPGRDGFEVCAEVRSFPAWADIPILIVTGTGDFDSIQRAYEIGATDFVTKPINYLILLERVRFVLRATQVGHALRASQKRLTKAQELARLYHWEWDFDTDEAHFSDSITELLELPERSAPSTIGEFVDYIHADDRELFLMGAHLGAGRSESSHTEYRIVTASGVEKHVHQVVEASPRGHGLGFQIVGTVQDVTDLRAAERRIRYLAYYDSVTGLPNRANLKEMLQGSLEYARRHGYFAFVMFLDLDNFKRINDTLGHEIGDKLLRAVAERLSQTLRCADQLVRGSELLSGYEGYVADSAVSRLGGDEFVVLLNRVRQLEDGASVARRVGESLARPFDIDGREVRITTSMGISVFPSDGEEVDTLLRAADIAMYHAKEHGRADFRFYNHSISARAVNRFLLETDLRKALDEAQFVLHFQPKASLESGRIRGIEALVRWIHPEKGLISPGDFIPVAEESGVIVPLGEWILREACEQLKRFHAAGFPELGVAVNISGAQFHRDDLAERVIHIVREVGVEARFVELELTESTLVERTDETIRRLHELKSFGLDLSIDDFGTGHSSLSYLKRFPLTALKIDQSFVRDLTRDPDDEAIVNATIALAHSLRLKVIAEGVERVEQMEFLRAQGCDEFQGYFLTYPLAADEMLAWLERHRDANVLCDAEPVVIEADPA